MLGSVKPADRPRAQTDGMEGCEGGRDEKNLKIRRWRWRKDTQLGEKERTFMKLADRHSAQKEEEEIQRLQKRHFFLFKNFFFSGALM